MNLERLPLTVHRVLLSQNLKIGKPTALVQGKGILQIAIWNHSIQKILMVDGTNPKFFEPFSAHGLSGSLLEQALFHQSFESSGCLRMCNTPAISGANGNAGTGGQAGVVGEGATGTSAPLGMAPYPRIIVG